MRTGKVLAGLPKLAGAWLATLAASPAVAQETSAMRRVGLVSTGSGTFSIDVEGADIRTVVRAIAEFSGRNIVVANEVKGTGKASPRHVGWREGARTILRRNRLHDT